MKLTNTIKIATKSLLSVGLLTTSLLSHADEFNLFSLSAVEDTFSQQSPESEFADAIGIPISTLSAFAKIQLAKIGDEIIIPTPDGKEHFVKIEELTRHNNGDISVTGSVDDAYRAMITHGKAGSYASIETPEGKYKIEIRSGKEWLLTPEDLEKLIPQQFKDDSIIPSLVDLEIQPPFINRGELAAAPSQDNNGEGIATIDVMVLYTPELKAKRGGIEGVESRINHLVSLTNQAYKDSKMSIVIRLVHSAEIGASNDNDVFTELPALKDGEGVFTDVLSLRASKGADLVVLMRDYAPAHTNCGLAYTLGSQDTESIPYGYRKAGYGVVHDGSFSTATGTSFCNDYTFAHELGHNFGFKHDRDHVSETDHDSGAFDYSYGHDDQGKFATIMSYNTPKIGLFSNPDLFCSAGTCSGDEPLGILEGENSANNAKAGDNVRFDIANFYESVNNYVFGDETGDGSVDISDVVAIINLVLSGGNAIKGGDCNGDEVVNIQDIICTINIVLEK